MARLDMASDLSVAAAFAPADADGEVQCPLSKPDGKICGKRCSGERRFRSIQEHIRRAHPDDYLPRLSATKESFDKMIAAAALPRAKKSTIVLSGLGYNKHTGWEEYDGKHDELPPIMMGDRGTASLLSNLPPGLNPNDFSLNTPQNTMKKPRKRKYHPSTDITYRIDRQSPFHLSISTLHAQPQEQTSTPSASEENDEDPDRTLEELDSIKRDREGSDEASRRWDELVFVAANATGVEVEELATPPDSGASQLTASPRLMPASVPREASFGNQITISYTPRVECSHCSRLSEIHESLACPECISGLCRDCAKDAGDKCPVCTAENIDFRIVRMRIR